MAYPRPGQLLYSTHPPHPETGHPPNQNKHNHVYLIYYIKTGQENIVWIPYGMVSYRTRLPDTAVSYKRHTARYKIQQKMHSAGRTRKTAPAITAGAAVGCIIRFKTFLNPILLAAENHIRRIWSGCSLPYFKKSSRIGLKMSTRTPSSRHLQPCMISSCFKSVSPCFTSWVSFPIVNRKRPFAMYVICVWG